jgi:ADP-ribosylglycohydrolase
MWVAAMTAAAFVTDDIPTIIQTGLAQIPENSRLTSAIEDILEWVEVDVDYDTAVYRLHELWNEETPYGWTHTIPNAMIVAMALVYGEKDYGKSICRAVQPCFDTDCNGATTGSILGILHGRKALPSRWADQIHDTLHTGVAGYATVKLSEMARASREVIARVKGRV